MRDSELTPDVFPSPRDDEPPSLRADILDELADHLACATQRELRRTDDAQAAEQAALAQFGDPARLARRLWFDWMKEKIVKDRIMLGLVTVVALACVATAGVAWYALQQNQRVTASMLEQLKAMNAQPVDDWTGVSVRIVAEGSKKPLVDVEVQLSGKAFSESGETLRVITNEHGEASFGPIRPGQYHLNFRTADLQYRGRYNSLTLYRSQPRELTIACPLATKAPVAFSLDWGAEPPTEDLLIRATFKGAELTNGSERWQVDGFGVWLTPDGRALDEFDVEYERHEKGIGALLRMNSEPTIAPHPNCRTRPYRLTRLIIYRAPAGTGYRRDATWEKIGHHRWEWTDAPGFEAREQTPNAWSVALPAELTETIRATLAEGDDAEVGLAADGPTGYE